jgi:hypothetical protein
MTNAVLHVVLVALLGWEGIALVNGHATISQAVQSYTETAPVVSYVLGALVGHFAVQPPAQWTLAARLGEPAEVAVVGVVGLVVFSVIEAVPWWGDAALLALGVIIGAFAWTIGV